MLRRLFLLLLLVFCVAAVALWHFATSPVHLASDRVDVDITSGVGLRGASQQLVAAGIAMPAWQFVWMARLLGKSAQIKAGSYQIETGITPLQLLEKLTRGDSTQSVVTLVEGKTFADFRNLLDSHPDIRHDTAGLSDSAVLKQLGIDAKHGEGLFFPDSYAFSKNSSDLDIYRRAHQLLARNLESEWGRRAAELPYQTPYEALIMASIVEKETGDARDREQIAAVFVNRLRAGMRLQTDPSVIYGLRDFDGNLRKRDLEIDTPYNTYTRSGLPPTPIALPGQAALHAALNPASSNNYYFVARGDGSSEFSRTLDEHNRAVARYQKQRK